MFEGYRTVMVSQNYVHVQAWTIHNIYIDYITFFIFTLVNRIRFGGKIIHKHSRGKNYTRFLTGIRKGPAEAGPKRKNLTVWRTYRKNRSSTAVHP